MLPVSSLSKAAYGLRDLLMQNIDEFDHIEHIKIGHPSDTVKDLEALELNGLNLFFYDMNYDGYPSDGTNNNPFYVRLNCLITAVGQKTNEPEGEGNRDVSKGENELRMIGEVMRVLHKQPVLSVNDGNDNEIAQLQIVPYTMNLDNLNHIWSTQNDISYRLSIAYEMSLAPVPHALPSDSSPLVTDTPMVSAVPIHPHQEKENDNEIVLKPIVEYLEIDTDSEDWMPHICLVEKITPSEKKLHYVFKVDGDLGKPIDILIAGKDKGKVKLVWSVWRRKKDKKIIAWKEDIADEAVPLEKEIKNVAGSTEPFFPNRIDPDNIDSRRIFNVKLPDVIKNSETKSWQAMLYAIHEYKREEPPGSGELVTTLIKSNSVLLYGVGP